VPVLASCDLVALVGVADVGRARRFYCDVLGLSAVGEDAHAVTVDANGTLLRLTAVGQPVPAPYSVLAWRVDDIGVTVDELVGHGVVFARYDSVEQDARGVWTAPDGAAVAWFLDPDGNNLSLVQFGA
jgi:catechol 2,3-dioxygenase-like lactoylglutathione lyase family enzyme